VINKKIRMNNNLDPQYQALLQDILKNGVEKGTRNGKTKSVFPRTITHNMSEGFPLLTTKKMYHKGIFTELLWLLRGDTNIQCLCQNNCNIWVGDAYKPFEKYVSTNWHDGKLPQLVEDGYVVKTMVEDDGTVEFDSVHYAPLSEKGFIERIIRDDDFAEKWGDLGPIYGKQWRNWNSTKSAIEVNDDNPVTWKNTGGVDQIAKALDTLVNNPDCRRNIVNAWKVDEIDKMTLPPCHWAFQLWTRELNSYERQNYYADIMGFSLEERYEQFPNHSDEDVHNKLDALRIPKRAISLVWHQRSVDTFLGLPFNIASYGALLEIFGKLVNMVPETITGTLGDTHLYSNHFEQAKEQIGKPLTVAERYEWCDKLDLLTDEDKTFYKDALEVTSNVESMIGTKIMGITPTIPFRYVTLTERYDILGAPVMSREPFQLPKFRISTELWNPENVLGTNWDEIIKGINIDDFQIENYNSHGRIKAPLSN